MKQDQQFVFQPSQLTVMACENKGDNDDEGKKDGESTHDRLDEKVTADNDLEEIGSKHNSPLAMMEPISKFDASLTCFHTLDGKNIDMHTAELLNIDCHNEFPILDLIHVASKLR
jgi:hypothetical protein